MVDSGRALSSMSGVPWAVPGQIFGTSPSTSWTREGCMMVPDGVKHTVENEVGVAGEAGIHQGVDGGRGD
jgi:hypothetical protein